MPVIMSSTHQRCALAAGQAHVWLARPNEISEPALLTAYAGLLSRDEDARRCRFRLEHHRHTFLVAHALVRATLSRYSHVKPQDWQFRLNAYGRPEVADDKSDLRFNLSHTDGLVACAVSRVAQIGVDVESSERKVDIGVADRFFSAPEIADLKCRPEHIRRTRFLEYWTLKESYIKARGMGLALPLGGFAFALEDGRDPEISFLDGIDDDPGRWRFRLLDAVPGFVMALCLEVSARGDAKPEPMQLEIRETTPLRC